MFLANTTMSCFFGRSQRVFVRLRQMNPLITSTCLSICPTSRYMNQLSKLVENENIKVWVINRKMNITFCNVDFFDNFVIFIRVTREPFL